MITDSSLSISHPSAFKVALTQALSQTENIRALALTDAHSEVIAVTPDQSKKDMEQLQVYGDLSLKNMDPKPVSVTVIGENGCWMCRCFHVEGELYTLWALWSKQTPCIVVKRMLTSLVNQISPLLK